MRTANPHEVLSTGRMWAAVSPIGRGDTRWIDYTSIRPTAKAAKDSVTGSWEGGWPDLRKRGWSVVRVVVTAVE